MFSHFFLLVSASLTRALAQPFRKLGLSSLVAPSHPPASRSGVKGRSRLSWLSTGGVAGGGFFEFERGTAWIVLPLAVVYVGKVVLSNISYALVTNFLT